MRSNKFKKNFKYFRLSHDLHQASENSYFKPEERSFRGGESVLTYDITFISQNDFQQFCTDFDEKENFPGNIFSHRNQHHTMNKS